MTPDLTTFFQLPELYYTSLFEALPSKSVLIQNDAPKFTILAATPLYLKETGTTPAAILGKGVFEAFPVNTNDPDFSGKKELTDSFQQVLDHKAPCSLSAQRYDLLNKDGSYSKKYWRISNAPVLAPDGSVAYIIHTAEEITGEIKAREGEKKIKGREPSHNLFLQVPVPIQIYKGRDLVVVLANEAALSCLGKGREIIGKPMAEVLPEMKAQGYTEQLLEVMDTGKPKCLFEEPVTFLVNGKAQLGYYNAVYQPYYEESKAEAAGVLVVAFDVTDKVLAKKQTKVAVAEVEKQRRLYETITGNTPDLIYVFDLAYRFTYANRALLEMWGRTWEQSIGKGLRELGYEEWHALMHEREIDHVVATQESIRGEVSFPHATLGKRIYDYIFVPVVNEQGQVEAIAGTTRDITDLKRAEEALRRSERQQAFILQLNDRLRALADPTHIQQEAAGLVAEHLSADRVGYAEDGGDGTTFVVTLDYTKGVPSLKGTYSYDDFGAGLVKTLRQGHTMVRSDIVNDPALSGNEKAAFAALQLGAVVNVPLLRNGELIAVFFMHFREARHWTAEEVALMEEVAGRTWETVVRARSEQALRESEEALEKKVQERTMELEKANRELVRSNNYLEEFAYAASHDLKEPIRKIHFFAGRLKQQLSGQLTQEQDRLFGRMEHAAERMNVLIEDLLAYSNVSRGVSQPEAVDLNEVVQNVLEDLELEIQEKGATVAADPLPVINGQGRQLQQLFQNLLTNGLKYCNPRVPPRLHIRYTEVYGRERPGPLREEDREKKFHLVEVSDNGIGFEQQDAERIFNMFTRLHGVAEYKGSGIGLSIARKVVDNHEGFIWAESCPGMGATFSILLPAM